MTGEQRLGVSMKTYESGRSDPLNFWQAVEAFSPQDLPKKTSLKTVHIADYSRSDPLPWEIRGPLAPTSAKFEWRHSIYLGVFDLDSAWDLLDAEPATDYNVRPAPQSAVVMITVDRNGSLVPGSAVLSQCVWAAGKYRRQRRLDDVFSNFDADQAHWLESLEDLVMAAGLSADDESPGGSTGLPLDHATLAAILAQAVAATGVGGLLSYRGGPISLMRIKSEQISVDLQDPESAPDFLNSFFSSDLSALSRRSHAGEGARQYLGRSGPSRRIDVRRDLKTVYESVAPKHVPDGRWPSKPNEPLALSQQFAVNRALADLGNTAGIFSVNGPPGTGKTTMLRDLVAALVTQRASALAKFEDPSRAFLSGKSQAKWNSSRGFSRTVHELDESVRGFEIVIASSNNGAVENISLEIPGESAIAATYHGSSNYFPAIATLLLDDKAGAREENVPARKAWGLLSAKLGRTANKSAFGAKFLFGKKGDDSEGTEEVVGFEQLLKNTVPADVPSWSDARQAFLEAQRDVHRLRDERQRLHDGFGKLHALQADIANGESEVAATLDSLSRDRREVAELGAELAMLQRRLQDARSDLATHLELKPGVLEQIFTFARVLGPWRERQNLLSQEIHVRQPPVTELEHSIKAGQTRLEDLEKLHRKQTQSLTEHRRRLGNLERALQGYGKVGKLPPSNWFEPGGLEREMASPWLDEEYNDARSFLFLQALNLHQAFIFDQRHKMRQNILAVGDVLLGAVPDTADSGAVRAAWESLFMVVPTITTTFASIPRMFGPLKDQQLGWLFIDEAGQAAPQHAYGGIARSRRSVLVGDPLQLKPVVTLPDKYQEALQRITTTGPEWLPSANPAQVLADRTTRYGTLIQPPGQDELWIGAPLRVHRRCDNPMFDAVNQEVYGGLMIHGGTSATNDFPADLPAVQAPSSAWFHVATSTWNENCSMVEMARLKELLSSLRQCGYDMSDILVISPFRDSASAILAIAGAHGINAQTHSGTIHRAQGKEAGIVILVLGGRSSGSRNWAVGEPNLFNVAVSRAQRRLYVVGDFDRWQGLPYFSALAPHLQRHDSGKDLGSIFRQLQTSSRERQ